MDSLKNVKYFVQTISFWWLDNFWGASAESQSWAVSEHLPKLKINFFFALS